MCQICVQCVSKRCHYFFHMYQKFAQSQKHEWTHFGHYGKEVILFSNSVQNMSKILDSFWTLFRCDKNLWTHFPQVSIMCPTLHLSLDALWTPRQTWTLFGHFLDTFLTLSGHILNTFWIWTHFGYILGTFWILFEMMCPKCVRPYIVDQSRRGGHQP